MRASSWWWASFVAVGLVACVDGVPPPADAGAGADGGAPVDGGGAPVDGGRPPEVDAGGDAALPPPSQAVFVRVLGAGSGRVTSALGLDCSPSAGGSCYVELPRGTPLRLDAMASAGSRFEGWSVEACGAALGCDVQVESDLVIEATFSRVAETLSLVAGEGGQVEVSPLGERCAGTCSYAEPHGSVLTLIALADADHLHTGWTDDCAAATGSTCVVTLDAARTVRAVFAPRQDALVVVTAGTGEGRVVSTPVGIDCPGDCTEPFVRRTSVSLVASAAEGSDFVGWEGACAGIDACSATVDGPTVAVASFVRRTYDVAVATSGDGVARVRADLGAIDCGSTCRDRVGHGTTLTLTASPEVSSRIVAWGGACASAGDAPSCTLTITGPVAVTLEVARRRFDVAVTRSGTGTGAVVSTPGGIDCGTECSSNVPYGTALVLSAIDDPSSTFDGWSGACSGTTACALTVTAPVTVDARFSIRTYSTTVAVEGLRGGTGRVISTPAGIDCGADCAETWSHGERVSLLALPALGSTFLGWQDASGACAGAGPCALTVDRARSVVARFEGHTPVRLDPTHADPDVRLRAHDLLAADLDLGFGAVRSDVSIAPGSGVFYFEGHRLTDRLGPYGVGVGTASQGLEDTPIGSSDQSVAVTASAGITYDGMFQGSFESEATEHYGVVVDYRGAHPIVHLIVRVIDYGAGTVDPTVHRSIEMTNVTTPLYILVGGRRTVVGPEIEINPGNDTTNFPFHYDVDGILRAAGLGAAADELVMGWGSSYAGPPSAPPELTVSADQVVANGAMVTVTATATDPEDGDVTDRIEWEQLSTPHYAGRVRGSGGSFTFAASGVGIHPALARVIDSSGRVTERVVRVQVPGPVTMHATPRLEYDALTGEGILLDSTGTRTRYTGGSKSGIRANQSCYGTFWYFEFARLHQPENMGGGLVTGMGNLNPFSVYDLPQTLAINVQGASWWDLIPRQPFPGPATDFDHYGVAVDYRGEHPIVHVIIGGVLSYREELTDVWTEFFPMLYGNPLTTPEGSWDEEINFGQLPFAYDPVQVLSAEGIDTSALVVGWGLP